MLSKHASVQQLWEEEMEWWHFSKWAFGIADWCPKNENKDKIAYLVVASCSSETDFGLNTSFS